MIALSNEEIYQLGCAAYRAGLLECDNPFNVSAQEGEPDFVEWYLWDDGWRNTKYGVSPATYWGTK